MDTGDCDSFLRLLGRFHTLRGTTLSWDKRQADGEAEMKKALAVLETLAQQNPEDVVIQQQLLHTYTEASSLYEELNDELSFEFMQKARALVEDLAAKDALNVQAQQAQAQTYSRLGLLAFRLHRPETISYLEKSPCPVDKAGAERAA